MAPSIIICMDWRHIGELHARQQASVYSELKNLCVWNKNNGGMGSFYRSKHELVFVFKVGTAPHLNTVELGAQRALPHKRLGLRRRQHHARRPARRLGHASDRQAGRAGHRRDQGLLAPRRSGARSFWRLWHDFNRRREIAKTRARYRN